MLRAKNGCLSLGAGEMDYIRFGSGPRVLVMLPGVSAGPAGLCRLHAAGEVPADPSSLVKLLVPERS